MKKLLLIALISTLIISCSNGSGDDDEDKIQPPPEPQAVKADTVKVDSSAYGRGPIIDTINPVK